MFDFSVNCSMFGRKKKAKEKYLDKHNAAFDQLELVTYEEVVKLPRKFFRSNEITETITHCVNRLLQLLRSSERHWCYWEHMALAEGISKIQSLPNIQTDMRIQYLVSISPDILSLRVHSK